MSITWELAGDANSQPLPWLSWLRNPTLALHEPGRNPWIRNPGGGGPAICVLTRHPGILMCAQVWEPLLSHKKSMPWGFKEESSYWEGGWGENLEIFLKVCCIWDRPWGVGWILIFICSWTYLLQLPSVCLYISFTKVINSLDSNLKDLLAVPYVHFNWLTMNWGFHQHMFSYTTGNYDWRHFVRRNFPFQT